jgi:hypothetical protein
MNDGVEVIRPGESGLRSVVEGEVSQQVATAKAYPRDLKKVHGAILSLATVDAETAASCFFSVPKGGKAIEGPSIRMAEILASAWGNLRIASRIVEDAGEAVICEGVAWDVETNVVISAQVSRVVRKKKRAQKRDADDVNLAAMSGQAIARRNAILQVIPGGFIKKIMGEVRRTAIGDASTLPARVAAAFEYLAKMGVESAKVFAFLGVPEGEQITGEQLLLLRGVAERIKAGETTVDEVFATAQTKAADLDAKLKDEPGGLAGDITRENMEKYGRADELRLAIEQADTREALDELVKNLTEAEIALPGVNDAYTMRSKAL